MLRLRYVPPGITRYGALIAALHVQRVIYARIRRKSLRCAHLANSKRLVLKLHVTYAPRALSASTVPTNAKTALLDMSVPMLPSLRRELRGALSQPQIKQLLLCRAWQAKSVSLAQPLITSASVQRVSTVNKLPAPQTVSQ